MDAKNAPMPSARRSLEVRSVGAEALVHDSVTQTTLVLTRELAEVLALCDGVRDEQDAAVLLGCSVDDVRGRRDRLDELGCLEPRGLSRRTLLQVGGGALGVAGAAPLLLPVLADAASGQSDPTTPPAPGTQQPGAFTPFTPTRTSTYQVTLVGAAGGGGATATGLGNAAGGAGGAGAVVTFSLTVTAGSEVTLSLGGGGGAGTANTASTGGASYVIGYGGSGAAGAGGGGAYSALFVRGMLIAAAGGGGGGGAGGQLGEATAGTAGGATATAGTGADGSSAAVLQGGGGGGGSTGGTAGGLANNGGNGGGSYVLTAGTADATVTNSMITSPGTATTPTGTKGADGTVTVTVSN